MEQNTDAKNGGGTKPPSSPLPPQAKRPDDAPGSPALGGEQFRGVVGAPMQRPTALKEVNGGVGKKPMDGRSPIRPEEDFERPMSRVGGSMMDERKSFSPSPLSEEEKALGKKPMSPKVFDQKMSPQGQPIMKDPYRPDPNKPLPQVPIKKPSDEMDARQGSATGTINTRPIGGPPPQFLPVGQKPAMPQDMTKVMGAPPNAQAGINRSFSNGGTNGQTTNQQPQRIKRDEEDDDDVVTLPAGKELQSTLKGNMPNATASPALATQGNLYKADAERKAVSPQSATNRGPAPLNLTSTTKDYNPALKSGAGPQDKPLASPKSPNFIEKIPNRAPTPDSVPTVKSQDSPKLRSPLAQDASKPMFPPTHDSPKLRAPFEKPISDTEGVHVDKRPISTPSEKQTPTKQKPVNIDFKPVVFQSKFSEDLRFESQDAQGMKSEVIEQNNDMDKRVTPKTSGASVAHPNDRPEPSSEVDKKFGSGQETSPTKSPTEQQSAICSSPKSKPPSRPGSAAGKSPAKSPTAKSPARPPWSSSTNTTPSKSPVKSASPTKSASPKSPITRPPWSSSPAPCKSPTPNKSPVKKPTTPKKTTSPVIDKAQSPTKPLPEQSVVDSNNTRAKSPKKAMSPTKSSSEKPVEDNKARAKSPKKQVKEEEPKVPVRKGSQKVNRNSAKKTDGDHDSGVDESTHGHDGTTNGDVLKSPSKIPGAAPKKQVATSPTKTSHKSPVKSTSSVKPPRTPEAAPAPEKKKLSMNKIQVGAAPSPNLKVVRSKIGSLDNTSYKPGGGKVKIENRKLDFSKANSKIAAKNDTYSPGGGDKKIQQVKLTWNAKPKVGSLDNATHKPGGGDKKIETVKLDFKDKAKPKIGSKDNVGHTPGGGTTKIESQKVEINAQSKVGSLANISHKPGGGEVKIFDDKSYLKQVSGGSIASSDGGASDCHSPVPQMSPDANPHEES